jgi:hypothetical protein
MKVLLMGMIIGLLSVGLVGNALAKEYTKHPKRVPGISAGYELGAKCMICKGCLKNGCK